MRQLIHVEVPILGYLMGYTMLLGCFFFGDFTQISWDEMDEMGDFVGNYKLCW